MVDIYCYLSERRQTPVIRSFRYWLLMSTSYSVSSFNKEYVNLNLSEKPSQPCPADLVWVLGETLDSWEARNPPFVFYSLPKKWEMPIALILCDGPHAHPAWLALSCLEKLRRRPSYLGIFSLEWAFKLELHSDLWISLSLSHSLSSHPHFPLPCLPLINMMSPVSPYVNNSKLSQAELWTAEKVLYFSLFFFSSKIQTQRIPARISNFFPQLCFPQARAELSSAK